MPQFKIEQIAISVPQRDGAVEFLQKIGLADWFYDRVYATGHVFDQRDVSNVANLAFNYQAGNGADSEAGKPLEFEVLEYTEGANWIGYNITQGYAHQNQVSHLGMHVTAEELLEWRALMSQEGVGIAQEVLTNKHENPAIRDKRFYNYVIFDTRAIIGVDLKFIVRIDVPEQGDSSAPADNPAI